MEVLKPPYDHIIKDIYTIDDVREFLEDNFLIFINPRYDDRVISYLNRFPHRLDSQDFLRLYVRGLLVAAENDLPYADGHFCSQVYRFGGDYMSPRFLLWMTEHLARSAMRSRRLPPLPNYQPDLKFREALKKVDFDIQTATHIKKSTFTEKKLDLVQAAYGDLLDAQAVFLHPQEKWPGDC